MRESSQRLDITQTSDKAIIDWLSFSIGADELVRFWQPSSSSITLNRVRGGEYSAILGRLIANGRVLLINPNGILFGKNARVDVGGLVATTIEISDEDFLEDRLKFGDGRNPGGTVVNRGRITAVEGGLVALVAPGVENSGLIHARLGRVALASGNSFTLDLHGDNLIQLAIDDRVAEQLFAPDGTRLKALVGNSGSIVAAGGTVILTAASAAKDVVDNVINVDGIVEARSAVKRNGEIVLQGMGEGVVRVSGTLDASGRGTGETGGKIKVLGEKVGIVGDARIDASGDVGGGEVLVGGNFQGRGPERNADYTTIGGDVEIRADAFTGGDGGRVIVWSDRVTRFYGSITARGGSRSGNGGFVEVSGKRHLRFAPNSIDLSAPKGSIGELLLDPRDITISDADGSDDGNVSDTDTSINFGDDSGTDYSIKPSAFEAINADITLQATRDITVNSDIDRSGSADSTLTLQAGRHLTINAAITGTNGAHSFIFEADSPRSSGGGGDGTGTLTIGSNGSITSNNGDITLIAAEFSIDSSSSVDAGTGDIHIAPSQSVTMTIGGTSDTISAAAFGRFTTTGTIRIGTATTGPTSTGAAGSAISASSISITQALNIGGSASLVIGSGGTISLSADISTADGDITFSDPVTLAGAVSINSDKDADNTNGSITFTSTVDGAHALTLNADGGMVDLRGSVGGTTKLASLAVSGGAVSLKDVKATGAITVTGFTRITLAGAYESDDGNIGFTGAVTLADAVSVNSDKDTDNTNGSITFTSTVDGAHALTLNADGGMVDLRGSVGGTTKLASLTVTGGAVSLKDIKATGAITVTGFTRITLAGAYESDDGNIGFTGAVTLAGAVSINSDKDTDNTNGSITFTSTVDGAHALTLNADGGMVDLRGSVGGTTKLASLTVSGGAVSLKDVKATGAITVTGFTRITLAGAYESDDGNIGFTGAVTLADAVSVNSDKDTDNTIGSITFTSTVDGAHALTLSGGTGAVELRGAVTLTGTNRALTVNGGQIDLASVSTSGTISVTGTNIDLNGASYTTTGDNITFTGPVDLHTGVTVGSGSGGGRILFTGTIGGAQSLTLSGGAGAVELRGAVTLTGTNRALTVNGGQIDLASVSTSGTISVTGTNIDLNGASYTTTNDNITFTGPVDLHTGVAVGSGSGGGRILFTGTIGGAHALTLTGGTGAVELRGAVTLTGTNRALTVSGGQIDLASVSTSGTISVTGTNIDLNGASYTTTGDNITFTGPVDLHTGVAVGSGSGGGRILFTGTIGGAHALTLSGGTGAVELRGAVTLTGTNRALTVNGGQIDLASVSTSGTISVTGTNIDLNGASYTTTGDNITFTGPVDLHTGVAVGSGSGGGRILFTGTIGGAQSLTLTGGAGAVELRGAVTLGGTNRALTVSGGQIDLASVSTTGAISVTGTNIDLNGATYGSQDGAITFTGPVDLHTNVRVDSDQDNDNADGTITFTSTVNAVSAGAQSLTLDADGGNVELRGAVGGTIKLNNLIITGHDITFGEVTLAGRLTLNSGGAITLKGNITVDDTAILFSRPVILGANVRIDTDGDNDGTDGSITFSSTVNGAYSLTLDADGGAVTVSGSMGGSTKLTGLTVTGGAVSLRGVKATGAITVTGSNGITLAGAYESNDGSIRFAGAVTLAGAVSVDSDKDDDGNDGTITFTSTVNGGRTLTLDADGGAVNLQGAVGGTTRLTSLTVDGGQIDLNTVATTGAIDIEGMNIDLNGSTYGSQDGAITFTGPVDLHTNVRVDSDQDNDNADGPITFTSTVNAVSAGAQSLTLDADGGDVELRGAVGGTIKLNDLTITGDDITLGAVTLGGTLTLTPGGTITLKGNITVDDTAILFSRPVILGANVRIDTDGDNDGTDGSITFSSTVNGAHALTLDADTAAVTLSGAVGGSTKLTGLTVDGGQIDLNTVATTGSINIEGTNIDLNGASYSSNDGAITFTGPVDLHTNVSVDSDQDNDGADGPITFTSTVNGAHALTLDADGGTVNLQGAVGGTTRLTSLTVTGGVVSLTGVKATGAITVTGATGILLAGAYGSNDGNIRFAGAVTLTGAVSVDSDQDNAGTDGSITFTSTVNGGYALTLDADRGAVNLQGAVGGVTRLTSLTVDGGQIDLASVATTGSIDIEGTNIDLNGSTYGSRDGAITFTGPVDLHTNVRVDSDQDNDNADGTITFTSTVNAVSAGAQSLTLDADGGNVELRGAVGGTTRLTSLTVDGGQIDLNTVATTGAIDIEGTNIDLNGSTYGSNDGNIRFTGPVDLHTNVRVDSDQNNSGPDGNITFTSTVNGARTLTLDADGGAVTVSGSMGGSTKLTSLTVTGGAVSLRDVKATGAITVTGSTGITLAGAYESDDANIRFVGAVTLAGAVSVDSDKDDDGNDGTITFTSTVNGGRTLTLDADGGAVNLQGAVGGTTRLTSLTVDGGQIDLNTVATTGAIDIEGTNIDLNGSTYGSRDGNIRFTGPVDLHTNVSVDSDQDNDNADGSITFTSTVNAVSAGAQSLTLDADRGAVALLGAVGGTTRLASLTVDGGQIDVRTVATTGLIDVEGTNIDLNGSSYGSLDGHIRFAGPVDLHTNVSVDSDQDNDNTDGPITFTSTVNGPHSLTLDADRGTITLLGAVGGMTKLTTLTATGRWVYLRDVKATGAITVTGNSGIYLVGAYESDDANIRFIGAVNLQGAVSVDSDKDNDGTDGSITFTSTVNGGHSLTLDADTAAVTLQGAAGGSTRLTSLTVDGGQIDLNTVATTGAIDIEGTNIDLNGATYGSQDGNIRFAGPVDLHTNVRVDSDQDNDGADGSITFTSTENAVSAGAQSLTLDADRGMVTLSGAVGGTTKLTSLTVTGGRVSLKDVKTTGAITVNGPIGITLDGVYESDDGSIRFIGPVTLAGAVSVDSDKDNVGTDGSITFSSTVNGAYALTLDADGGSITVGSAVGGTTKLASFTATGRWVYLSDVKATGAITVTGSTVITLAGAYESNDGDIRFTGPVTLSRAVSVDSDRDNDGTDGSITFTSTVNGGYALTLDADTSAVTLSGAVGGVTRLTSLTVDGGQIDLDTVATTGSIDIEGTNIDLNGATYGSDDGPINFNGPVDLHTNVRVDSDSDNDGTAGNIRFHSTVDAANAGTQSLTLDAEGGDVELRGAVGGSAKLASLTVDGGQIDLAPVATTGSIDIDGTNIDLNGATYGSDDGDVDFRAAVELHTNVSVDSDQNNDGTDGNIRFHSTVNGGHSLTLDADTAAVTLSGAVGGTTRLASLTVDGNQIDLNSVATTGAIDIEGTNIDLNGSTYGSTNGAITFTGPVDLHTNVTVDSDQNNDGTDGSIIFTSTVDGGHSLTLDADTAAVSLSGAVGGTTRLASLTVDGGQIDLASVAVTGAIEVEGTNIDLNGATYGSTNGSVTFTGPVDLHTNVTVDSDQNNDGTDGNIIFTSTVDAASVGAQSLTLDADSGAVELRGAVGGTTKLASLTVDGGQIDLSTVASTGLIDIEGTNIDLNGSTYDSDDGNIRFTGPVDLHTDVSVDSDKDDDTTDGSITFTSTIDAAARGVQSLTLDADTGTITIEGAIGGTTALRDLTTNGGLVELKGGFTITGDFEVPGAITLGEGAYNSANSSFGGPVTLTGNVAMTSSGNAGDGITFGSTITGTYTLVLTAGDGTVTISGEAGTEDSPLASLTVTGGGISLNSVTTTGAISITGTTIDLNGMNYRSDDGDISFNGPTNLNTDVTMDSDANDDGTAGSITFADTVSGVGHSLTIVRADDVTVRTTMTVASFQQLAGTGTTDFGANSLHAETFVDVSTGNILGAIFAEDVTLKASNLVRVTVEVGSLMIEAKDAHVTGTVDDLGGQAAADSIIIANRGPGIYKANGFTILGTGPGTRTYAELTALPFSVTLDAARHSSTPASAAYGSFMPVLRASVTGATVGPFAINAHEMQFPLFSRQPSTTCDQDELQCVDLNMN